MIITENTVATMLILFVAPTRGVASLGAAL